MKKTVFIITIITFTLLCCSTCILANNAVTDAGMQTTNSVRNIVGGAENTIEGATKGVIDSANTGINNVKNAADNSMNNIQNTTNDIANDTSNTMNDMTNENNKTDMNNNGNYDVFRTSTESNSAANTFNTFWTWTIIAIIGLTIVGVIWYYSVNTHNKNY